MPAPAAVQAPAPAPAPVLAPEVRGDTGVKDTAAGGPSLRACTTTARACTPGHSQVEYLGGQEESDHNECIFSSGTLNPALQDENGQPKRDITTIVHILNDLLCAQYKAYGGSNSGSSRSSKHHHHRESKSSSQHSEAKSAVFGK